jgi:hypothetical protein
MKEIICLCFCDMEERFVLHFRVLKNARIKTKIKHITIYGNIRVRKLIVTICLKMVWECTVQAICIPPIILIIIVFVLNSTLLHLPPLRFHCAHGCRDRMQLVHWQTDALTTRLDLIRYTWHT